MANAPPSTPPRGIVRDIVPGICRVAFLHLTSKNDGGQYPSHKFEVHALWKKDDAVTVTLLRTKALEAARQTWPGIAAADLVVGLRDGDEKANLDGFPGSWFVCAKSSKPVPVYGPAREPLTADAVTGGDYCRVCVSAGSYKRNLEPMVAKDLMTAGRKVIVEKAPDGKVSYFLPAVTFYLNAVQLVRRGEAFGGGGANPAVFPDEGGTADGANPFPPAPATGGAFG
jgi:hypothetical protein